MKTVKRLSAAILVIVMLLTSVGCYMISGQKMRNVKGIYKLTHYTYTPKYERKEGYTPRSYNYIEDEEYRYEDYLIITGTGMGYYVHKEANAPAYVKEVTLSYEYSTDDSSKVEYVVFNDAISVNENSGFHRMGVTKNRLNYTKSAIDYTELFTKRPMRSEAMSVRWEKVSRKTDLEYVEGLLGELKKYDYTAFGVRGIYQRNAPWDIETGVVQENPYRYFYYVIDTADNVPRATAYYAYNKTPTEQIVSDVEIKRLSEDWSQISVDGVIWNLEQPRGSIYYSDTDGQRCTISRASSDISDASLQYLINIWLPTE